MKKNDAVFQEELLEYGPVATILGVNTEFTGIMEFDSSVQVDGKFAGEIRTEGLVVIGPSAVVHANIFAGNVVLGGEVVGNIVAKNKVNLLSGGKLVGNIKAMKLKISDGVVFDGNCEMEKVEKQR